ncbi:hypothetical protein BCU68_05475 [Vibrio sp. 10N.286.49.B3]|uniref:DUF3332 domain-containing protein n=1 Tax=Vibrio sp. 10N.286.49.B3 TaxID=1880855 RepID=UPI000C819A73|nr:DUF3332 domain-containing protein [Vibrio sp. 10N.286.49.B3]PMH41133.1 hypothetical protein BCU68_05475 [Vibrio sp. 10N.286.49.B3]
MKKNMVKIVALLSVVISLSGCVGSMAVTGKLMELNVKAVDNRYARGGLNFLLAPVYALTTAGDYIIFNSIEFWSGKNPINGSSHIFDTDTETFIDINHKLDENLKTAPIAPLTNMKNIETGVMQQVDENTIQMDITYNTGEKALLVGIKDGEVVQYFIDGELVTTTTMSQLKEFSAQRA